MLTTWRTIPRAPFSNLFRQYVRSITDARPFREGDIVILRQKLDRSAPPILTRPLKPGKTINGHKGLLSHDDIIGKRVRDLIRTAPSKRSGKDGVEFRLHEVKLDEYVRLSKRLVTPIYPADARLIVELLDLHPEPCNAESASNDGSKLEILEAGTGHGALTLYLSRAIHTANPPAPVQAAGTPTNEDEAGASSQHTNSSALEEWKQHNRRAVIHSIEHIAKYSHHARSIVKGFRHGMYAYNIDFYITNVSSWTRKTLTERNNEEFLSHAFLDLPGADAELDVVSQALRTDGCLVVFQPSITQILECQRKVREDNLALELENVVELGVNGGTGGREWQVRSVKPKATPQRSPEATSESAEEGQAGIDSVESELDEGRLVNATQDENGGARKSSIYEDQDTEECNNDTHNVIENAPESTTNEEQKERKYSMICRPKVGERIIGGGFLGVWRKQRR